MSRRFIGVRWWLGAAFALVAAVSTAIVVSQFSSRSETALRVNAENLAAGSAQLIALRLRRLSLAAEALARGDFESPLRYRFRDEFGALAHSFDRMRRQLRRSFRHIEGERDRLRLLLERLHEGVVTVDGELVVRFANAEARRVLGVRLAEGDTLPEPWTSFSLREF